MFADVRISEDAQGPSVTTAVTFLGIAFLLLLSREIKFDQFDIVGDRVGKRVTIPMQVDSAPLNIFHLILVTTSLFLLAAVTILNGKFSLPVNALIAAATFSLSATLLLRSYLAASKERFYKETRIVMLIIPFSMLLSF
jgi:hypothetical protein